VVVFALAVLLPLLLGTGLVLYDAWRDSGRYVVIGDARVAAPTAQARAAVAGQVGEHLVRVGDAVREGDVVAWVAGPDRLRVNVRAPLTGTVLDLPAAEGAAVGAGQPVVTIGDLERTWVEASVSPAQAARLQAGQPAQVRIGGLGTLQGTATVVTAAGAGAPASGGASPGTAGGGAAGTGAPAHPAPAGAGGGTPEGRPAGGVPVRIDLEPAPDGLPPLTLYPGMTAEVRLTTPGR
jgi:multidrug resistance efflux pump